MPVVKGKGTDDTESLDLTKLPNKISETGLTQFTVGDLHANTVKLIYTLIRNGVCTLPSKQYEQLVTLYQNDPMSEPHLSDFCKLVDSLKITNKKILVRLIGDMVADRGRNDLLTLKVLDKLRTEGVPVRITMSNHDDKFMKFFNDSKTFAQLQEYTDLHYDSRQNQANSYTELVKYIKAGNTEEMKQQRFYEVKRMVLESYLPNLVLLDYARSEDGKSITLFSHAPIHLNNIFEVAKEFGIPYDNIKDDGTPIEKLIAVIDAINQDYQTNLQLGLHSDMMEKIAIKKIAWQRHKKGSSSGSYLPGLIELDVDPRKGTPSITYVHGHDQPGRFITAKNAICIDNDIGKGNLNNNGDNCVAYVSNEAISPGPVNQLLTATTIGKEATDNKLRVGYERVLSTIKNKKLGLETSRGMGNLVAGGPKARYAAAAERLEQTINIIKEKQNTIPTTKDLDNKTKLLNALVDTQTNDTISEHFKHWKSNVSRYSLIERDFIQSTIALKSVVPLLNNNANVLSVFPTFASNLVQKNAILIAKAYHAPSGPANEAPERVAVNLVAAKGGVSNITTPNEYEKLATADKNEVAMEMAILYMKECYRPGQIMTIDNGTPEEQARISAALTHLVTMKCNADNRGMDKINTKGTGEPNVESDFNTWLKSNKAQYTDYFEELKKPTPKVGEQLREITKVKSDRGAAHSNDPHRTISSATPPIGVRR